MNLKFVAEFDFPSVPGHSVEVEYRVSSALELFDKLMRAKRKKGFRGLYLRKWRCGKDELESLYPLIHTAWDEHSFNFTIEELEKQCELCWRLACKVAVKRPGFVG